MEMQITVHIKTKITVDTKWLADYEEIDKSLPIIDQIHLMLVDDVENNNVDWDTSKFTIKKVVAKEVKLDDGELSAEV